MAKLPLRSVLRHLHQLAGVPGASDLTDRQLLDRFAAQRDEAAFAALVRRHGPLVLGVCWRVLHHLQDAEDAFQATFLVLARKAAAVRWQESVGNWLYEVAYRLAAKAKAAGARREVLARHAAEKARTESPPEAAWRELGAVVDVEVQRLPEKYRAPLLLCYWEGKTRDEAAQQLGWTLGAVKGRLERGRDLLRSRLARRGISLSVALLAAASAQQAAAAAPALVQTTARAAILFAAGKGAVVGGVSCRAVALAEGLRQGVLGTKVTAALVLATGLAVAGVGVLAYQLREAKPPAAGTEESARAADAPKSAQAKRARTDRYGDPLPAGALARLGTVRLRHRQSLNCVTFSPDGKLLASTAWDETIRMWDSATGKPIRELTNLRREGSFAVAFSPDGTKLASVSERGKVRLWAVVTGEMLYEIEGHKDRTYGVAFAPDGRTFASAGHDGLVRLWDATTGKEVRSFPATQRQFADTHAVAFSGDGTILASGQGQAIRLWDPQSGALRRLIARAHGREVLSLCFMPDNKTLISGGFRYVDASKEFGQPAVRGVGEIRLWDTATGKQVRELKTDAPGEGGCSITLSPDGKVLAVAYRDKIQLLDLASGKPIREIPEYWNTYGMRGRELAFSPDGKRLAALTGDNAIHLWDVATGSPDTRFAESHSEIVESVVCATEGQVVVTGSRDGSVRVWDTRTGKQLRRLVFADRGPGGATAVALSPDGQTIAAGGYDFAKGESFGPVKFWNLTEGTELRSERLQGRVNALTFSPDGKMGAMATSEFDRLKPEGVKNTTIHVWDSAAGRVRTKLMGHEGQIRRLAFSPDSKILASAADDMTVRLWDVQASKQQRQFILKRRRGLEAAAFSVDGKTVVTSELFGDTLFRWELATGRELGRIQVAGSMGSILALSPDGRILASGSIGITNTTEKLDYSLHLWEVASGREIFAFQPGSTTVTALAFCADGERLVSGMDNGTVLIWDVTGRVQQGPPLREQITTEGLKVLWNDLASKKTPEAYRALWTLVAAPQQTVPLLKEHLRPIPAVDQKRLAQLITDLDNNEFARRQKATAELEKLGELAEPALRKGLAGRPTLEVRQRLEQVLEKLSGPITCTETLRALRAVAALEHIGTPEARQVLVDLAQGAAEARLTQEAKASFERPAKRGAPVP